MSAVFFRLALFVGRRRFRSHFASEAAASCGWAHVRARATGPEHRPRLVNTGLERQLLGNRESSLRPSTRHNPLPKECRHTTGGAPPSALTGRWRCARAQAPFAVAPEQACSGGIDEVPQENRPGRPRARAGERARRHRPGARSQREKGLKPKWPPAARQCTARHPAPARPTVPRETPTHQPAAPPIRPPGACPSSPSTPRPV